MSELSAQHLRGPPARRRDLMPVEDLPGYRVDREIGQGAMGRVYLARDLALGREVAVKGIHRDWDDDDQARERLRREARLLARLRHPNIVQVYELLVVGRELWIVMEFVPGLSLTRCGPWKPEQVVCLVRELASALAYAHASHIVHLDLKPSNVLISEDGMSRLTDFGVARFLAREAAAGSGTVVYGTPAYLAPERCRGEAAKVDGRADVYSLAVMTYELLLGRLPFEVDPDDPRRTLEAHAQEPVPRPRDLHPDFPQAIERVLLLGLTKDPRARPRATPFRSQMRAAADRVWPGWE